MESPIGIPISIRVRLPQNESPRMENSGCRDQKSRWTQQAERKAVSKPPAANAIPRVAKLAPPNQIPPPTVTKPTNKPKRPPNRQFKASLSKDWESRFMVVFWT